MKNKNDQSNFKNLNKLLVPLFLFILLICGALCFIMIVKP